MEDHATQLAQNAPLLAQQAVDFLKPHLLAAAGALTDQALAKAGEGVSILYGWLKSKLTRHVAKTALEETVKSPKDDANWDDLRGQLIKLLQSDAALQRELGLLLPHSTATEIAMTVNQSGSQNVATQITGKQNSVNVTR